MILGIAIILVIISFEILLYRVDRKIDLIMKDLGIEDKRRR